MPGIENTSKRLPGFIAPLLAGPDHNHYIENMEREGQAQFVESDLFPATTDEPREVYEVLGFVFGEPVVGDPLFVGVTLPAGWERRATSHDMWSEIIDADGKPRVKVFYKAAYYDRGAFAHIIKEEPETV